MDKKIPKVFANKIDKEVGNNERVYYGNDNNHEFRNDGLNINLTCNGYAPKDEIYYDIIDHL
mgnify:CR=1 FL=1